MGLSDVGRTLPPGFRFYPSDEELVGHYLYKKIANEEAVRGTLVEIDLHTCEPWQLPEVAKLNSDEWYFFSFRDRKYATGYRTNRATTTGYWKATGKDRAVLDPSGRAVVGMRKTLVFYKNRAPNGMKTGWIMHEFRLENPHLPPKDDWVLCRVFNKWRGENGNKSSPQNLYDSKGGATATSPHLSMSTSENVFLLHNTCQNNIHHQGQNPRTSLSSSAVLDLDPAEGYFPDLCHENDDDLMNVGPRGPSITSHHDQISKLVDQTKCDDDYGLLFDGIFDYSIDGEPSNLDDMRFVDDGNNSLVFL